MPTVTILSPVAGAKEVAPGSPALVRIQRSDSNNYIKVETSQADFAAGTLTNVEAISSGALRLLSVTQTVDDFEDDTIGQLPTGWDVQFGTGFTVQSSAGSKWAKHVGTSPGRNAIRWTAQGSGSDQDVKCKWKIDNTNSYIGVVVRLSGGSGTETCYLLQSQGNGTTFRLYKLVNGTATQLGSDISFAHAAATEYWMRLQIAGSSPATIKGKIWAASGAEPGAWNVTQTDSAIASGYVGMYCYSPVGSWYDLFTLLGVGAPGYETSGNRVSPAYPLSSVGKAGAAVIDWDDTIPASTTLTIKTSIDGGTTWSAACTKGQKIEAIAEGDDLSAKSIQLKQELATSDASATPILLEVRLIFLPVNPAWVNVKINGVDHTVANNRLRFYNDKAKSGSAIVDDYRDLYFFTGYPSAATWFDFAGQAVTYEVFYDAVSKATAGVTLSLVDGRKAFEAWFTTWTSDPTAWILGAGLFSYTIGPSDLDGFCFGGLFVVDPAVELCRGEFAWSVIAPSDVTADGFYWVATPVSWEAPGAFAVGSPALTEGPGAFVVHGWARTEGPGAFTVQGYIVREGPGAFAVALPFLVENPGAFAAAARLLSENPGGFVVYAVQAGNVIEIRVLGSEAAAARAAMGITIP